MTITTDSPLVGPPSGALAAALDFAGTDNAEYVRTLWALSRTATFDPALALAQWAVETADGTSARWLTNRNPAGLAVEADGDPDPARWTPDEAARVHAWALVYATSISGGDGLAPLLPDSAAAFRRRWMAKHADPNYPVPATVADLQRRYVDASGEPQAVWAWDDTYAVQIVAKHRAIFGAGGNTMATPATIDYAPLPFPMRVNYVPPSQTNNRPGIAMTPSTGTWHETANTSAGADSRMHERWLLNGAPGAAGPQVGVHFFVDDTSGVQMIPLNEVAWHAGDGAGPGNYSSIAVECCVNSDGDLAKAQDNVAALFGLLRARGIVGAVVQHNHWSGKDCPHFLRAGEVIGWSIAQAKIGAYAEKYGKPAAPVPFPITWEPGDIGPVDFGPGKALAMLAEVKAKRTVPLRQGADTKSPKVGELKAGQRARLVGTYKSGNGQGWYVVELPGAPGQYGRALRSAFWERYPVL